MRRPLIEGTNWCKCYDFKTTGTCPHVQAVVDVGQPFNVARKAPYACVCDCVSCVTGDHTGCYYEDGACQGKAN